MAHGPVPARSPQVEDHCACVRERALSVSDRTHAHTCGEDFSLALFLLCNQMSDSLRCVSLPSLSHSLSLSSPSPSLSLSLSPSPSPSLLFLQSCLSEADTHQTCIQHFSPPPPPFPLSPLSSLFLLSLHYGPLVLSPGSSPPLSLSFPPLSPHPLGPGLPPLRLPLPEGGVPYLRHLPHPPDRPPEERRGLRGCRQPGAQAVGQPDGAARSHDRAGGGQRQVLPAPQRQGLRPPVGARPPQSPRVTCVRSPVTCARSPVFLPGWSGRTT